MSRLSSWDQSSFTRSTGASTKVPSSTSTSNPIPVDYLGWPVVEVQRAVWPRKNCQRCKEKTATEYVPTDWFGSKWHEFLDHPEQSLIALCKGCFGIARSEEGRRMGYKSVKGKTKQYVIEELFGGDLDGPSY